MKREYPYIGVYKRYEEYTVVLFKGEKYGDMLISSIYQEGSHQNFIGWIERMFKGLNQLHQEKNNACT